MSIELTFFDTRNRRLPAGTALELLADGEVVATAAIGEDGAATFDADPAATTRLTVRVKAAPREQGKR